MDLHTEVQTKLDRVRALMDRHGVDTLWLRRTDSVAWITGGLDASVNTADTQGVASVVITRDHAVLWTTAIEAPRMRAADQIEARGFDLHEMPWHEPPDFPEAASLGTDGPQPGATDLSADLFRLRAALLPVEQDRFRALGALCADAMQAAVNRVKPGHNDYEIGAALAYETRSRGACPVVVLVATDARVYDVRHPLPVGSVLEHYAMLVLCGRKDGLVCSITRLVHFGALPDDLRRKQDACAQVDAAMIAASQPGATLVDVFQVAQDAYAAHGFDGEWRLHHQGGLAGYKAREVVANAHDTTPLSAGMACAWNPSITGTKSEDTVLVTPGGQIAEVLTPVFNWPVQTVSVGGLSIDRPLILEVT